MFESDVKGTPKSSQKNSTFNCSHPPLIKVSNPSTPTVNNASHRSFNTPKYSSRTTTNLRTSNRKSNNRIASESNTPCDYKRMPLQSPRRSAGNPQRIVKSAQPLRRCSSYKKPGATPSPMINTFSIPYTPLENIRAQNPGLGITPPLQSYSDSTKLRRSEIHKIDYFDVANLNPIDESSPVSVGVRVRPLNERELSRKCIKNIVEVREKEVYVFSGNGSMHSFFYDHCFWSCDQTHPSYASQSDVYVTMAKPLLEHAFEGYNVCLFAYGQTGSGKSYCIMGEGPDSTYENDANFNVDVGIIPRFCSDLFKGRKARIETEHDPSMGEDFQVEVSYIEIYNEKIYDLIGLQQIPSAYKSEDDPKLSGNCIGEKREALRVREHPITGPYIVGASCHGITSYQDLQTWLSIGNKQRSIAATGMNDKSSRSHSVFSIKLTQRQVEENDGEKLINNLVSTINLVDLAGSERVASSFSEGERLKEGVCINKSLLTLGKVITALAESGGKRKVFIPYRESVLTFLLKESLGGNSKTAMIATISPCDIHQEETLSTLRYAQKARKIVNWNHVNEDPAARVIRTLRLEVERLRAQQLSSPCATLLFGSDESEAEDDNGFEAFKNDTSNGDINDLNLVLEEKQRKFEEEREMEQLQIIAKEEEISALKKKLKITQEQLTESNKQWEQKLVAAEACQKEALEVCRSKGLSLKVTHTDPALVNLCDDPQLSQTLLYTLGSEVTSFGQCDSDVILRHLHHKGVHCKIKNNQGQLFLYPEPNCETYINGKFVSSAKQIFHNDRLVLAGIYYFLVSFPVKGVLNSEGLKDGKKIDFYFTRDELLKEQEERLQKEMAQQKAAVRAEMLRELEEHRKMHKIQSQHFNENLKILSDQLDQQRQRNEENELSKLKLTEEKIFLEEQMNKLNKAPQDDFLPSPDFDQAHFFDEVEALFNESRQIVDSDKSIVNSGDIELWFLITEANNICKEIRRPYEFKHQNVLTGNGLVDSIMITDLEHNLTSTLPISKFKDVVDILRDIGSQGDGDEDMFESSICWQRIEESSQVPFLIDKLKENYHRLSLNSSINVSSISNVVNGSTNNTNNFPVNHQLRKLGAPRRRRSSLLQTGSKVMTTSEVPRSSYLAKAAASVLTDIKFPTSAEPPFNELIRELIQMITIIQEIQKYNSSPTPSISSDDHLSSSVLKLVSLIPCISKSLLTAASIPLEHSYTKHSDIQTTFISLPPKLRRKVIRLFQGIETETEELVDEECKSLFKEVFTLINDVGFLSVISGSATVESSVLASNIDVSQSYLTGASKGLEWQVANASQASQTASSLLLSPLEFESGTNPIFNLSRSGHIATSRTAQFLEQFSQLQVTPELDSRMDVQSAVFEITSFLDRVETASENARQLMASLATITQHLGSIDTSHLNLTLLQDAVRQLQESLGALVDDAGVGSNYRKATSMADASQESVTFFLESLHTLALKALKSINSLAKAIDRFHSLNDSVESPSSTVTPLKSSLGGIAKAADEKRVRFNVSLKVSSSPSASVLERSNSSNLDA